MNKLIRFCVIVLMLCTAFPLAAQRKKTMIYELGLNRSINLGDRNTDSKKYNLYFQMSRMIKKTPISIDFTLAFNTFKVEREGTYTEDIGDGPRIFSFTYDDETSALSLIPSINYHFYRNKQIDAYAGIGIGASFNAFNHNIVSDNLRTYATTMPRIGALFFNHINISFEYYAYYKKYNRGTFSFGYVF